MDTLTIDVRGLSDHSLVSQSLMRGWLLSGHARGHWLSPVSPTINCRKTYYSKYNEDWLRPTWKASSRGDRR